MGIVTCVTAIRGSCNRCVVKGDEVVILLIGVKFEGLNIIHMKHVDHIRCVDQVKTGGGAPGSSSRASEPNYIDSESSTTTLSQVGQSEGGSSRWRWGKQARVNHRPYLIETQL